VTVRGMLKVRQVWQPSYYDRRVWDANEYLAFTIHSFESGQEKTSEGRGRVSLQYCLYGI
jgi:NADH:ubiquinone oxidoreductase subunit 3 (subunit A)